MQQWTETLMNIESENQELRDDNQSLSKSMLVAMAAIWAMTNKLGGEVRLTSEELEGYADGGELKAAISADGLTWILRAEHGVVN